MKKFYETQVENTFNVEALISLGHGKRLREHKPDAPCVKDGRVGVKYDFWQLIYMEEGSYACRIEGCPPCRLEKGQLLICEPKKIRFSYESSTAVAGIISIKCSSPKMMGMKNQIFSLSDEEKDILSAIFSKSSGIMCILPENSPYRGVQPAESTHDYQLQVLKNYIELLLISLYAHTDTKDLKRNDQPAFYEDKFRMIEEFMKANIQRNLTVDDILAYTGSSLSTVKRIFQQQADCGIIRYFRKLKIEEAKRLLREGELTVTQVSDQLGFSSVHHFSNLFKKYTGVTPSQYPRFGISK